MRTTITLAEDVAKAVEQVRRQQGAGISEVVNDLVRRGLREREARPRFVQATSDMGLPRYPMDDIGGLLDILEGPDRRE